MFIYVPSGWLRLFSYASYQSNVEKRQSTCGIAWILIKPRLPWEQPSLLLNFTFGIHLPLDNTSDLWLRSGELVGQSSIDKQTIGK